MIRYCCDNPLTIIDNIESAIKVAVNNKIDLVSCAEYSNLVHGTSQIVMSKNCIDFISKHAKKNIYREHIENYCYDNPNKFKIYYAYSKKNQFVKNLSLTVDYKSDFNKIKLMYTKFKFIHGKFDLKLINKKIYNFKINTSEQIYSKLGSFKKLYNFTNKNYQLKFSFFNEYTNEENVYCQINNKLLKIIYNKNKSNYILFTFRFKNYSEALIIYFNLFFVILRRIYFHNYANTINLNSEILNNKIKSKFLPIKKTLNIFFPRIIITDKKINGLNFILVIKKPINKIKLNDFASDTMFVYNNFFCIPFEGKLKKIKKFNLNEISEIWQDYEYSFYKVNLANQQF